MAGSEEAPGPSATTDRLHPVDRPAEGGTPLRKKERQGAVRWGGGPAPAEDQ